MRKAESAKIPKGTKRYFFSILFLFLLISSTLIILSTAYYNNETTHVMTDAFAEKHQRNITQLSILFDNIHAQLIPGIKEASMYTFFYSNLMFSDHLDRYEIMLGMDSLDDMLLSYPLIHSIYLYNGQMNFFLTTTSGLEDAETFYDKEVLDILTNFNRNFVDYYWPRTACFPLSPYQSTIHIQKRTLTLLMGTTPTQKAHLKGAIIVNLDLDEVTSLLSAELSDSKDEIFIYNQNGEYITHYGDTLPDERERIYEEIRALDKEQGVIFENGKLISFQYNFRLGWYFIGIMPLENINRDISQVTKTVMTVMSLFMLAAFLFSYFSARFIYRPINKLLDFVSSGSRRDKSCFISKKNEIALIQEHYLHILSEKDILEDSLQNLNEDYRVEIYHSLLDGNHYHFWMDELQPQDQLLLSGFLELYLFQIDDFYERCSKMDPLRFRQIRKKLIETIRESLEEENEMLIDMTSRNLVCLIPKKEDSFERIARLHEKLLQEMPISLSLGCASRQMNSPNELHLLYEEAVEKAGEKFLTGFGKIHRAEVGAASLPILPPRYMDSFFSALLLSDRDQCFHKFDQIILFLKKGTYRNYRQFINLFSYRFLLIVKDWKDSALIPRLIHVRNNPQTLETLDSFSLFFSTIISEILKEKNSANRKTLAHYQVIEKALGKNFADPSFCVQTLALETGLSPNYLRKIYRDHTHGSLSERIIQLRQEEACRLLRETQEPIKELYEKAGFINYNSFFTSFKKGTGLTPAQYRRNNQSA